MSKANSRRAVSLRWLTRAERLRRGYQENLNEIIMKAIDALRLSLKLSEGDMRFFEEMRDAPLSQPMSGGNHPMWLLGHLTVAEGRMHQIITGEVNPVAHWRPLFDWGTTPSTDASVYPPFDEVMQTYRRLRMRTTTLLEEIGDDGLDRPTQSPPPGLEEWFATVGQTIITILSHQAYHAGQASVARRAAGKQPSFVPSKALREF